MNTLTKPVSAREAAEIADRIEEPAKAWRNWYRALQDWVGTSRTTGEVTPHIAGDIFCGPLWPSKEIAEQKVHELRVTRSALRSGKMEYLGTYPDGVTP